MYGAEGIWGGDNEEKAPVKMWDAFQWNSASQVKYLKNFAFSIGENYQDLEPLVDLVTPNKNENVLAYEGWAYCARTPDKNNFLIYFERGCPQAEVRGAQLNGVYSAQWFDPRNGTWKNVGEGKVASDNIGIINLPLMPSNDDWGLKLVYEGKIGEVPYNKPAPKVRTLKNNAIKLMYATIGIVAAGLVVFLFVRLRPRR